MAIAVATAIYGTPVDQAVLSAAEGATFGLFPIMWIVVLGRSITSVSNDARIQAVLVAWCFGTLMEALAGFGAPAAIRAVMMVARRRRDQDCGGRAQPPGRRRHGLAARSKPAPDRSGMLVPAIG